MEKSSQKCMRLNEQVKSMKWMNVLKGAIY